MTSLFGLNLIQGEPSLEQLLAWKPSILVSFNKGQANRLSTLAKEWGGRVAYRHYPDNAINNAGLATQQVKAATKGLDKSVLLVSQNEPGMSWEMVNYEVAFATAARQLGYEVIVGAVGVGWPIKTTGAPGGSYVDWQGDPENVLARFMSDTEGVYYGGHEYHEQQNPDYGVPFYVGRGSYLYQQRPGVKHFVLEHGFDSDKAEYQGFNGMNADVATATLIESAKTRYLAYPANVLGVALFGWGNGDRWGAYNVQQLGENNLNKLFAVSLGDPALRTYRGVMEATASTSLWSTPGGGVRLRRFSRGVSFHALWAHESSEVVGLWKRITVIAEGETVTGWVHLTAVSFDPFTPPEIAISSNDTETLKSRIAALELSNAALRKALEAIRVVAGDAL